jgi:processive 1,2-diacylglycerol beta-glucosyltransferase
VRDVELTVVCGSAKGAVERVERVVATEGLQANVLGFERDMAARVRDAHVVVGKAGGLTVTESLVAGRPMVLVGTVPGNELANEELVVSHHAGYASTPADTGALVNAMRARGEIAAMGRRARALVRPGAAAAVVDRALSGAFQRGVAA